VVVVGGKGVSRGQEPVPESVPRLVSQPVLLEVVVEGNESVPTDRILAAITTRATAIPTFDRYAILFADLLQVQPTHDSAVAADIARSRDIRMAGIRLLNIGAAREDAGRIRDLYHGFGFHDVVVDTRFIIDTIRNVAKVRYLVNEAFRYRLRGIHWVYTGSDPPPDSIRRAVAIPDAMVPGDYFAQEDLYADINNGISLLKNSGYPTASLAYPPRVFFIRGDQARALGSDVPFDSAEIVVAAGRRSRFGTTDIRPDSSTVGRLVDPDIVVDQLEYASGDWYSREKLDQSQANIYELGLFDVVSFVDTTRPGNPDHIDFRVFVRQRPQNDFRFAPELNMERRQEEFIYNSGLSSQYSRINLLGGGELLGVNGRVLVPLFRNEELQAGLGLNYSKPSNPSFPIIGSKRMGFQASTSYDFKVVDVISDLMAPTLETSLRNRRFAVATEFSWRLPIRTFFNRLVFALRAQWNKYFNVRGYVEQYESNLRIESVRSGLDFAVVREYARQNTLRPYIIQGDDRTLLESDDTAAFHAFDNIKQTWVLSGSVVGDRRNDIFVPTNGYLIEVGGELGASGLLGFSGLPVGRFNGCFLKGEINYRYFKDIGSGVTLAVRGHIGVVKEWGPLPLTPTSNRFIAGGANSIRGWAIRDMLATRSDLGIPAGTSDSTRNLLELLRLKNGGLGILEFSAELRTAIFSVGESSPLSFLNDLIWIPFVDAGNAFFRDREDFSHVPILPNIAIAAGMSLGYVTPVGPIRGGVGVPVYDPVDETLPGPRARWIFNRQFTELMVFHIGIGHAF